MHYNNPLCRGVISIGHNEANGLNANGRAVFSTLYDNTHLGEKQQLIFTYEQGDILRLQEYDTCIIHSKLTNSGLPLPCAVALVLLTTSATAVFEMAAKNDPGVGR